MMTAGGEGVSNPEMPADGRLLPSLSSPRMILAVFTLVGAVFTWLYQDYPVVRNSLFYAETVLAIDEHGLLSQEAQQAAYKKPMGFAVVAWPLTRWLGINSGLKTASAIATALFGISCWLLLRRLLGRNPPGYSPVVGVALLIALFNPLVLYQFVSAYPDSLFAALFLGALISLDRTFSSSARWWDGAVLATLIFFAAWIKHHGFVLLLIAPLFMTFRWRVIRAQWDSARPLLWSWLLPLLLLLLLFYLAQQGELPTFNLAHNKKNYVGGSGRLDILLANISCLAVYAWLSLSVLLLLPLWLKHWSRPAGEWLMVVLVFILTVLFYHGAGYNTRYFLAMAPFLAAAAAVLLLRVPAAAGRVLLMLFMLVNSLTTLYYNVPQLRKVVSPYVSLPRVDNLRLAHEQAAYHDNLALIRDLAPAYDNTLVFISSYYGGRVAKAWQHSGILPETLKVHYLYKWRYRDFARLHLGTALIFEYPRARENPGRRLLGDRRIRPWLNPVTPYLYRLKKPVGSSSQGPRPPFREWPRHGLDGPYGGFSP
jgi:hypothetical protein